jgi:hypothetical protein
MVLALNTSSRALASRALLTAFVVLSAAVLASAGCGRSNLDDYLPSDGGFPDVLPDVDAGPQPEGGGCNAATCPTGCCDGAGTCQPGAAPTACGTAGRACQSCPAEGFQLCENHTCGNPVAGCSAQNCNGCCDGNICFAGGDPDECGRVGDVCRHCKREGLACAGGECVTTACGPGTCNGCCFGGQCIPGTDNTACGNSGQACANCSAIGEACLSKPGFGGVCSGTRACGPATCPGCCEGNVCVSGNSASACGYAGSQCRDCASLGETCQGQVCTGTQLCGPQNCPGCCEGDLCVFGGSSSSCGFGGFQCQNCLQFNETCNAGQCVPPTACGPWNCNGCCEGDICLGGFVGFDGGVPFDAGPPPPPPFDAGDGQSDTACGSGGGQCQDCLALGETCQNEQCLPKCNQFNCAGCCDATQTCQVGFLDAQCGGQGNACTDCTKLSPPSTCDGAAFPVACQSQQTSCPSPYAGCNAPPTALPTTQKVCSATELLNARAACGGGATSPACSNFFNVEYQQNGACASCLQPFDYELADLEGVFACIAPWVTAVCNQSTACDYDCRTESCASCPDSATYDQCRTTVDGANGQCASYSLPAERCEAAAFAGAGAICDPSRYGNDYGAWLQAVGTRYCGM